jgi:hypothetical protein
MPKLPELPKNLEGWIRGAGRLRTTARSHFFFKKKISLKKMDKLAKRDKGHCVRVIPPKKPLF